MLRLRTPRESDQALRALCIACAILCYSRCCPSLQAAQPISFNQDIRPILSENCFLCHGPDEENRSAGLRLDEREAAIEERDGVTAIVPGQPDVSELIRRIDTTDLDDQMPPPDSERALTPSQRSILRQWIEQGAPYERHWSFEPIRKPAMPSPTSNDPSRNPIDRFILNRLEGQGLSFSPPASAEKLIRRVTFDLTGLPPTLDEIDAFLEDAKEGRWERLVDRLLQREAYGERLASEWLDVARYSDTYGYQVDRDRFVWPWRDWVIDSFNRNLPYDEFITWQLAGDLLPGATREQILATTFNRLHPQKVEGGSVPEEFRIEYVADRAQTVATAFLGLTFECARCHDHKYDPLKQREYYQLTSFFANIDEAGLYSYFTSSIPTPTMVLGPEEKLTELSEQREKLAAAAAKAITENESIDARFEAWLDGGRSEESKIPEGVAFFDFETFAEGKLVNRWNEEEPGTSSAANLLVPGKRGQGLLLTGDDEVDLKVGNFTRFQPFSLGLWLKVPEIRDRTVVFHRSRAWTDAGSRGYQMLLEDGKPSFSLIHFWPGNAIRVQAREALPVDEFVHLAVTYDGSIGADGIRLFVNGVSVEVEIVRDLLTKNMTGGGHDAVAIGARFRDKGFKQGIVDEFQIFDFELAELEVRDLVDPGQLTASLTQSSVSAADRQQLREYYRLRVDEQASASRDKLKGLRAKVCELENALQEIMVMKERPKPRTSYVLFRGGYDARRDPVISDTPAALPGFGSDRPRNRLGFAKWLVDPANPLTARVAVNRYWQLIFGKGLVRTPEDFGSQGRPPSHPDLLNWLAAEFIAHGWDVKRLIKQMVLSYTYRQDSVVDAELQARDPENIWLARGPRYRLPAEMIRDNALAVSGLLVNRIGGAPVKPYEVAVSFKPTKIDEGDGLYRRSLYTYWKRTGPAPVMMALDASKRDVCSVKRETTATPLQAFVFMNDPQFVEAARHLALRISSEVSEADERLAKLFRVVTSRQARPAELDVLRSLFADQTEYFLADEARIKSFMSVGKSEVGGDANAELAALTVVASSLFSHDECIMKR